MDIQKIQQYKSVFDQIAKSVTDDDGNNIEVWYGSGNEVWGRLELRA